MAMATAIPRGQKALLIDITRCIGCRACSQACQELHAFPGDGTDGELSATAYTVVLDKGEDRYVRKMCMHCVDPSCASVCPVGAFAKDPAGPVTYDAARCLGCRYCMVACPFGVPKYEWSKVVPAVRKCDFCVDRQRAGNQPACAEACPVEATVFGTREELLAEAHRRIQQEPDKYHPHVYGETEVGGTSVLFLSPVPFESLGFRTDLGEGALPTLTWEALSKIPAVVSFGGAALLGIFWITHRRQEVAAAEAASRTPEPGKEADDAC